MIEIFPSPLPEFLISSSIYEDSLKIYQKMILENTLVGNIFSKRGFQSEKYRVLKVQNYEDCINLETEWLTL